MAWLYKQANSKFWWIGDRVGGSQRGWSTKLSNRKEAEKVLESFKTMKAAKRADILTDSLYEALSGKQLPNVSLNKALTQWLEECAGATAPGTYAKYEQVARTLREHLKAGEHAPLLKDVTTADLFGYLSNRRKSNSASTVNLARRILSVFFLRCVRSRLLDKSPVEGIKKFKASKGEVVERRVYTLKELKDIYDAAPDDFWRYMIRGGFYTALRMGDLITLQVTNVNLEANAIQRKHGKTGKHVQIPMAAPLRESILPLLNGKGPKDYLWPAQAALYNEQGAGPFSRVFRVKILQPCGLAPKRLHWRERKKLGENAPSQINDVVFHCLRHSMNSELHRRGASKAVAMALLGHTNERTNQLYTHIDQESMREAISLIPEAV